MSEVKSASKSGKHEPPRGARRSDAPTKVSSLKLKRGSGKSSVVIANAAKKFKAALTSLAKK
jgi:hypothetical protein